MDLTRLPLFRLLSARMAWLSQRQEVLAQNVANADTPGFKPSDLAPMDFRGALRTVSAIVPVRTNPMHIGVSLRAQGPFAVVPDRRAQESPDGNAVDLEEQMVKMAQTQADYQLVTNLYRKQVGLIKAALGHGGS
ncbi:MAG: flagellar basal body rod protein FlgB [Rhodospirillaceae bacterium]|nr:flagellar basal body rod protein FlgB [Rhodospirillaceae bacterium]